MRIIKYFRFLIFFGIINGFIFLLSCSEGTNPNDKKFVLPDKDLSFKDDIYPLFYARCSSEGGCHSWEDQTPPQGRDYFLTDQILLNSYLLVDYYLWTTGEKLVDRDVDPRNPESSKLYLILSEGYPDREDRMPKYPRDRLTSNQLNGIKKWIEEGALDN